MAYLSHREAFGRALLKYGNQNDRVIVLDADTSSSTMSKYFAEVFPGRFINVGIAEPCMVDVAVGLAVGGFVPIINAFAALLSLRAVEQIRTCVAYANTNVKIVAGYSGLSDYKDGPTHHSIMDIGIMRMMPGMTVIVPADEIEIENWLPIITEFQGPIYLRLSREGCEVLHSRDVKLEIGKGIVMKEGSDGTIFAIGSMLSRSLDAATKLAKEGIYMSVVEMACIKPLDEDLIQTMANETGAFVSVEEHSILGGLGGAIAECISCTKPIPLVRVGIQDIFSRTAMDHDSLLDFCGMGINDIISASKKAISLKSVRNIYHLV